MIRDFLIIPAAILILSAGGCEIRLTEADAAGPRATTEELEALEERLAALELLEEERGAELEALQGRVNQVEIAGAGQAGRMEELEAEGAGLADGLEAAESGAAELAGRATALEAGAEALQGRVTAEEGAGEALGGRVSTLESGAAAQGEQVRALEENGVEIDLAAYLPGTRWMVENPAEHQFIYDGNPSPTHSPVGEMTFETDGTVTMHSGDLAGAAMWSYPGGFSAYTDEYDRTWAVENWGGESHIHFRMTHINGSGVISTTSTVTEVSQATAERLEIGWANRISILTLVPGP